MLPEDFPDLLLPRAAGEACNQAGELRPLSAPEVRGAEPVGQEPRQLERRAEALVAPRLALRQESLQLLRPSRAGDALRV